MVIKELVIGGSEEHVKQKLYEAGVIISPNINPNISLEESIKKYQEIHGLKVDGVAGPVTQEYLDRPRFCSVPDRQTADGSRCRWDHSKWTGTGWPAGQQPVALVLNWHVVESAPGFSYDNTVAIFQDAHNRWSNVCAIIFKYVSNSSQANLLYRFARIDRGGQTLAWQYLPCGPDGPNGQLDGRYDTSERWTYASLEQPPVNSGIDLSAVACHEIGHGIGLEHGPQGALLAPYYSAAVRKPQDWDIKEAQLRYGPPVSAVPPEPTPPPDPVPPKGQLEIYIDGQKLAASNPTEVTVKLA
jgi:hypothetical protein